MKQMVVSNEAHTEVAEWYTVICRTCGLESWTSQQVARKDHLARCGVWLQGGDCMHHEDDVPTCRCDEIFS